ncbi:hypothetical protein TNIN_391701 [Trichonephila inaurata madagascariensis]|uniref:Uncharacterized protein n=1 Tax=Trichonephila inaurata madagascariensis TaxID=2747483 RepID=A0A8X7C6F1_9ARAC|nr:hypothetical protein TNIN_391701 [Trichonephila inaurata madagascariensis]
MTRESARNNGDDNFSEFSRTPSAHERPISCVLCDKSFSVHLLCKLFIELITSWSIRTVVRYITSKNYLILFLLFQRIGQLARLNLRRH